MKLKKIVTIALLVLMSVSLISLSSCGGEETSGQQSPADAPAQEEKLVKMGIVNWSDSIAMSNIVKVVLEQELGFTVETTTADIGIIFSSIAQKDYDLYVDTWLPVTHKTYMDTYTEEIEKISTTYEGARIGLVVPEYVDIDSIEQLNDHKERFNSDIVGIDTGAGIMGTTETVVEEYGLDFNLMASSGPVMTATLKSAIDEGEWIVVTGWKPHWKFARWDLKFLEDPKVIYGEAENTWAVGYTGFTEDFPEVTDFLENFMLTDQQLGEVMGLMNDSEEEPYTIAQQWVADNPDAVQKWVE